MIKFRQKNYTIQEGHYTGPKDIEKVPSALSVIGKTTLAGTGVGAVIGSVMKDTTWGQGAKTGGKIGFVSGILLKILTNYINNPMSKVKYQEVDKTIRREFGIYQAAGITVGDSIDKRSKLEDRFSFNDRNVGSYKITVAIQDNEVTMYTLALTNDELGQLNKILDYYCKKYFGMEYVSKGINTKINSYAVTITFTNYQVISNFFMEVANALVCKINLLDNKALAQLRIQEIDEEEERTYSVKLINSYDLAKILGKGISKSINSFQFFGPKAGIGSLVMGTLTASLDHISEGELTKLLGIKVSRKSFSNRYLEDALRRMKYIEGVHYSVGDKKNPVCMSLYSGVLMISLPKGEEEQEKFEKNILKKFKGIKKTESGNAIVYTYIMTSREELDRILVSLMKSGLELNIFDK